MSEMLNVIKISTMVSMSIL